MPRPPSAYRGTVFGLQPWHLLVIVGAALLIFGPDRLPSLAKDAGKVLRQLRRMASDVRDDLKEELGPEIGGLDLKSMHPKALIHKHLLDPALDDVDEERAEAASVGASTAPAVAPAPAASVAAAAAPSPVAAVAAPAVAAPAAVASTPYDLDAT